MDLTAAVKAKARALGADLVGIAPVERFKNAPLRMSPQGLLPEAKSVVVMAIHHLDAAIELDGEPTAQHISSYATQSTAMNPQLDDLSFRLARFLEEQGEVALPITASNIWRYYGYKDLKVDFAPDLAHRYAAVAAGLAEIGWSGLALTPEFGPRQRFVSVVTAAELEPTPMLPEGGLCDECQACVQNCPTDAYRKQVSGMNEIEIGGRVFRFPEINKWRCSWAENFGLDLDLTPEGDVTEEIALRYMERYGTRGGEFGSCLRFCMVPELRYYDKAYSRAPRRKKQPSSATGEELLAGLRGILEGRPYEVMAVAPVEAFADDPYVNPEMHLPGAKSVISLVVAPPPGGEGAEQVDWAVWRALAYMAFDLAHYLDMQGYEATTHTHLPDNRVAVRMGTYEVAGGRKYMTVLTTAILPATRLERPRVTGDLTPEALRAFCREAGADLVGFFSQQRFAAFRAEYERLGRPARVRETVNDTTNYGPYLPVVQEEEVRLRGPEERLAGARSVIVLGLHLPDATLDTAKVTPAETVGPWAFVSEESLQLLREAALKIATRLTDAGWRATISADLTGLASRTRSSRGMVPDLRANGDAAVLAGLATLGVSGFPLTPEYGTRQRFLAIVTDMPLPNDDLLEEWPCAECERPCVVACPTCALSAEVPAIVVEGVEIAMPRPDEFACDWAKRYGLVASEGPACYALESDQPLPEERSGKAIAEAVTRVQWGMQKRHVNIVEECMRVCPRGRRTHYEGSE